MSTLIAASLLLSFCPLATPAPSGTITVVAGDANSLFNAISCATPGDTIIVPGDLGGAPALYDLDTTYAGTGCSPGASVDQATLLIAPPGVASGTPSGRIEIIADPTSTYRPRIRSTKSTGTAVVKFRNVDYWTIRGFDVEYSQGPDCGPNLLQAAGFLIQQSNHIVVENCRTVKTRGQGFQVNGDCSDILLFNCDAIENGGPLSGVDGFRINGNSQSANMRLIGCRATRNTNDGFQIDSLGDVFLQNCISWDNGVVIPGSTDTSGTGFKLGPIEDSATLLRCSAWDNQFRAFYNFGNAGVCSLLNCAAIGGSQRNIDLREFGDGINLFLNCISYGAPLNDVLEGTSLTNSWQLPPGVVIDDNAFVSADPAPVTGSRQPDGTIPRHDFLRPTNAKLINGGSFKPGINYYIGSAPDIGTVESDDPLVVSPSCYIEDYIEVDELLAVSNGQLSERLRLTTFPPVPAVYIGIFRGGDLYLPCETLLTPYEVSTYLVPTGAPPANSFEWLIPMEPAKSGFYESFSWATPISNPTLSRASLITIH